MKLLLSLGLVLATAVSSGAAPFELRPGDHLCIVGNTLAERMQHDGWLEALLYARFPQHHLVIRNLGYSGDELTTRLRSMSFGTPDQWLRGSAPPPQKIAGVDEDRFELVGTKADVIFVFFGYNESQAGPQGLEKFKKDLADYVQHVQAQKYNGHSPPRLVLFSPVACQDLHSPNLPDGKANNERIAPYAKAMAAAASEAGVPFVDLFTATAKAYANSKRPYTINGIHLNDAGNEMVAKMIVSALFGNASETPIHVEKIRQAVQDKNFYWFNRYRTVDGFSTYGDRAFLRFVDGQTNYEVLQRELRVLDIMTANRDRRIWAVAAGGDGKVDDGNAPPFIPVTTNRPGPGPGGTHLFLGGEEGIEKMRTGSGMKVNLFASEEMFPELANPVQITFDPRGRMWVAVMPSYPHWKPGEKMDDKVLILEDTDGDGRADRCTTFADGLHVPTGLELYDGGCFVAAQPDLLYLKDTDGDDVADVRERVLHGMDSADTHHALNSFVLDPGGALYFQEGTFHHTQVETPYGPPVRCANAGVFRYEPRTQKFEVYVSYPFANPHGHVFDRWGQDIVTDGTGNVNYLAAAFSGSVDFPRKHPEVRPIFQQRTRPCPGTEVLSSRHFPEELQGNFLDGNVIGFQGILQYKLEDDGSGLKGVEVEPIVYSSDPNFRPTDIEIGPDGAIYFSDWQNPIIGHMQHNLRDPSRDRIHGRVYRITYPARPLLKPAAIAGAAIERLLDLLKEPEDRLRYRAKIELGGRPSEQVVAAVGKWLERLDPNDPEYQHHLLEGLWVHQYHNAVNEPLLQRMLRAPDARARAAAVRVLCYWRDRLSDPLALLAKAAEDEHPRVRLEAVRACSFIRESKAAETALLAVKRPLDDFLGYALGETLATLEPFWKNAIASGQPFAADNPAGANFILKNVGTAELIKMARTSPVYAAMLSRSAIGESFRQEALAGLAKLNRSDEMTELLSAIGRLDELDAAEDVLVDLAQLLTKRSTAEISAARGPIEKLAAGARRAITRQVAYVMLIEADRDVEPAWKLAVRSAGTLRDLVDAVPLIHDAKVRDSLYPRLLPLLHGLPEPLAGQLSGKRSTGGRFVRIDLPGARRTLTLAEVQAFSGGVNVALRGTASQSNIGAGGEPRRAIDGNTSGVYGAGSSTHTLESQQDPWWEVDLGSELPIEAVEVWNRTDDKLGKRLDGFQLSILDANRQVVFSQADIAAPRDSVRIEIGGDPAADVRRAAIAALPSLRGHEAEVFNVLAQFVRAGDERGPSVRAIRRLPRTTWPKDEVRPLVDAVVQYAASVPPAERSAADVVDALQLGAELASALPGPQAKEVRAALGDLGVPVIVVRPVPHKMLFDRRKLYAEAGKPLEIVFENIDVMPHNLLLTKPGAIKEVGDAAERMSTTPDGFAKHFVPELPSVLAATRLLQPRQTQRLKLTAPAVGEYSYLCTFPGHWRTMYGTLHVVPSLAGIPPEELVPEIEAPADVRQFVRDWKYDELVGELDQVDHGRNFERGKSLFTQLTCAACHKLGDTMGQVGPELTEVAKKFKRQEILRELIDPSQVINDKFQTQIIVTSDGELVSGIIVAQDAETLKLMASPVEKCEPRVVRRDQIESQEAAKVSMMPAGLLVTLNKDEIFDLLAFVASGGKPDHPSFGP